METDIYLIKPMYPCQDVPSVILKKRCPSPCLYCDLHKRSIVDEEIIARGIDAVVKALGNFKGAYFSPLTDCFLEENSQYTHDIIETTWKINPSFVPLVVTKQIIPERTIVLFKDNRHRLVLQISIPSVNTDFVSILEPGASSVQDRLDIMKRLSDMGIPIIAIVMPWFDFQDDNIDSLPMALSRAGIRRCRIGTVVLPDEQKKIIERSNHLQLVDFLKSTTQQTRVTTKFGYTIPFKKRIEMFRKLSFSFSKYNIRAKVCTADNPDLLGYPLDIMVCNEFKHRLFGQPSVENISTNLGMPY